VISLLVAQDLMCHYAILGGYVVAEFWARDHESRGFNPGHDRLLMGVWAPHLNPSPKQKVLTMKWSIDTDTLKMLHAKP